MPWYKRIGMKQKLLFLVFLPSIVLLVFIVKGVMDDYVEIRRAKEDNEYTRLFGELDGALSALQKEERESIRDEAKQQKALNRTLGELRTETDQSFQVLFNNFHSVEYIKDDALLREKIQKIQHKKELLDQKRNEVDSSSLTIEQTSSFYNEVETDFIDTARYLSLTSPDANTLILTRAIRFLFRLQEALNDEILSIEMLHREKKITLENYQEFIKSIVRQDVFQEQFFGVTEIAFPVIRDQFRASLRPLAAEEQKIRQQVIQSFANQSFDLDTETWNDVLNMKIERVEESIRRAITILEEMSRQRIDSAKNELVLIVIAFILVVLGTIFLTFKVLSLLNSLQSLGLKIQEEVNVLASSAEEISTSINEVSSGTSETASSVAETTTTAEELKQMSQVSSEKAQNVITNTQDMSNVLKDCEKSLDTTMENMHVIEERMKTISESILKLSEHSRAIGEIIDSVNDIAEQSNLLAVNAAIEAAKAEDAGFAVVAQEIKSLAEQSKQATVQVRAILNEIQNSTSAAVMATEQGSKAVGRGVSQSGQTKSAISTLSQSFNKVNQSANQISLSSQQQLEGVKQMTVAMTNIKEATNQHVEHMKQIQTATSNLNAVGQSLKQSVEKYQV